MKFDYTKRILNILLIIAIFCLSSLPNIVYGETGFEQDENTTNPGDATLQIINSSPNLGSGAAGADISAALEAIGALRETEDPTLLQPNSAAEFDTTLALSTAAQSCFTAVLANVVVTIIGGFTANTIAKNAQNALDKARSLVKVPVHDEIVKEKLNALVDKEVGAIPGASRDGIAWCLLNSLAAEIFRATTVWIRNGFDGNPAFIDDPGQFFTDLLDKEAGTALGEVSDGFLCSPFSVQVQIGILNDYRRFSDTNKCRLSDIVDNFDAFIEGEFGADGWKKWFTVTQNPQHNPYGAQLEALETFYGKLSARDGQVKLELGWNQGWLSFRHKESQEIVTPGALIFKTYKDRESVSTQRLAAADEFDELLTALLNQVVKIAITEVYEEIND